jgi:hypothetical protein
LNLIESEFFDNRILTNETIRRVREEAGFPVESSADGDVRTKMQALSMSADGTSGFIEASRGTHPQGFGPRKAEVDSGNS